MLAVVTDGCGFPGSKETIPECDAPPVTRLQITAQKRDVGPYSAAAAAD